MYNNYIKDSNFLMMNIKQLRPEGREYVTYKHALKQKQEKEKKRRCKRKVKGTCNSSADLKKKPTV